MNDLVSGQSTDIKDEQNNLVPALTPDGEGLRVWDYATHGGIVDRFTKNYVDYVIVMFNHPDNPPSNQIRYLYLAPEKD